jgi:hypothetical protein
MKRTWLALACGLLVAPGPYGCGDDGAGSISTDVDGGSERIDGSRPNVGTLGGGSPGGSVGGTSTSPIPPSLSRSDLISELTPAEVMELCSTLDDELSAAVSEDDFERLSCTLFALLTSASSDSAGGTVVDRAQCDRAFNDCLSSGGGATTTTSSCDDGRLMSAAEGCPTTVGALADCAHASAQQLARAVDTFNCAAFSNPSVVEEAFTGPMDVAECRSIESECPALLDGDTSSGGPSGEPPASGCENTCPFRNDGECDDGGAGMITNFCILGTDCDDCGPR